MFVVQCGPSVTETKKETKSKTATQAEGEKRQENREKSNQIKIRIKKRAKKPSSYGARYRFMDLYQFSDCSFFMATKEKQPQKAKHSVKDEAKLVLLLALWSLECHFDMCPSGLGSKRESGGDLVVRALNSRVFSWQ